MKSFFKVLVKSLQMLCNIHVILYRYDKSPTCHRLVLTSHMTSLETDNLTANDVGHVPVLATGHMSGILLLY